MAQDFCQKASAGGQLLLPIPWTPGPKGHSHQYKGYNRWEGRKICYRELKLDLMQKKKKKLVSCPYELFNTELLVQKNPNIHQCLTCGPIHNAASTGWQCTGMTPRTKDSSYTHTVLVSTNMRQCYLKTKTGTPLTSEVTFCSQAHSLKH